MTDTYTPEYDSFGIVVVDMTRSLADPAVEGAYEVGIEAAERIEDLLEVARHNDVPVFFTKGGKMYHTNTAADLTPVERSGWPLTTDTREESPEQAEEQYEVCPSLDPESGVIVAKSAPSAFFNTMLHSYLSSLGVRTLVICGMTTSGCVRATVVDAFSHNYRVLLPEGCVADPRPELHEMHLADMNERYAFLEPMASIREKLRSQ